jgi:opacity protein-like surface antigen
MKTPLAVAALAVLLASPAFAQSPDDRIRVSFGAGLTAGAVDGGPSIAASAGYRFADRVSFDVEFTFADEAATGRFPRLFPLTNDLDFGRRDLGAFIPFGRGGLIPGVPNTAPSLFPIPIEGGITDGWTMLMSAGFRYEIPFQGTRFRPYVNAGIGVSRTEQTIDFRIASATTTTTTTAAGRSNVSATVTSALSGFPEIDESITHTGLLGSAGVGASLRVFRELSIDLNARFFLLDRDRQLGSFGGGVSYRF